MSQRFLPLIGTAFLAATLSTATLQAGASNKNGNPFGNGTYFNNSGTFSAVIRGQNLSGTVLFSTGANTNLSSSGSSGGGSQSITNTGFGIQGVSPGSSVVVYQGYTYQGNAAGMWNPASGSVSGQFWGGQLLSGSNSTSVYSEIYNSNNFPHPIPIVSNTVIFTTNPTTGGTNNTITSQVITTTNYIYVEPVGTNSYQDSVYMNGSFDGTMQNQYPNQTFTAFGTAVQQQLYPEQQNGSEGTVPVQMAAPLNIPITVQGVRVSDSYSTFNTISNAVPYSQTVYTMTNIATF